MNDEVSVLGGGWIQQQQQQQQPRQARCAALCSVLIQVQTWQSTRTRTREARIV